ncbi:MAG: peptidoglycan-binding domain-containing protein [Christensenellales bacterium]|jgi:hypothetical protein
MAIKYGSTGSDVKKLQQELNRKGANLKIDGIWGPKTQAAYEKYGVKAAAKPSAPKPAVSKPAAAKPSVAVPRLEYMQYTPMTEAQKRAAAKADTDPAYDARLRELEKEYASALQDNENEALRRGMSRSRYVLDVRSALNARKAENRSALQGERAQRIQALVAELTRKDEEKAEGARRYNNEIALQLEQMRRKQAESERDYEIELRKLAAQAARDAGKTAGSAAKPSGSKPSGSKKGSKSGTAAKKAPSVNYYDYYSKNYLQKYGNNAVVARVLYYADRVNLKKKLGSTAVKQLDAIADRLGSNSITAATMR